MCCPDYRLDSQGLRDGTSNRGVPSGESDDDGPLLPDSDDGGGLEDGADTPILPALDPDEQFRPDLPVMFLTHHKLSRGNVQKKWHYPLDRYLPYSIERLDYRRQLDYQRQRGGDPRPLLRCRRLGLPRGISSTMLA